MKDLKQLIEDTTVNVLKIAVTKLPDDVKKALKRALQIETSAIAKSQLHTILDNIKLADETETPMCQDTGVIIFNVKVGAKFPIIKDITSILTSAVRRGTLEIPLRPNAVDSLSQKNTDDNVGPYIPWINWKVVPGNSLEMSVLPKGGGSENMSRLGMLSPGQGITGLKRFVLNSLVLAGGKPCPPVILGIGVGGGADICMYLAKQAILRPLGIHNPNPEIASLEKELLDACNDIGIGPMGLGGKTTVLGVNIEVAARHPASYPVGLVFQCWAARRASVKISAEGEVDITSHEVKS